MVVGGTSLALVVVGGMSATLVPLARLLGSLAQSSELLWVAASGGDWHAGEHGLGSASPWSLVQTSKC